MGEALEGQKELPWSLPLPPLQPQAPDHPWGSPNLLPVLPQRMRAHLREGLHLLQHGLGGGLQGPGSLGHRALSRCDRLLQHLHLQAHGLGLGLLRLPGDGGLRQERSKGQDGRSPAAETAGVRLHMDPQDEEEPAREKPGWRTRNLRPDSSPSNF